MTFTIHLVGHSGNKLLILVSVTWINIPTLTVALSVSWSEVRKHASRTTRSIGSRYHSTVSSTWTTLSNKLRMILRSNGTWTTSLQQRKGHLGNFLLTSWEQFIPVFSNMSSSCRLMPDLTSKQAMTSATTFLQQMNGPLLFKTIHSNQVSLEFQIRKIW